MDEVTNCWRCEKNKPIRIINFRSSDSDGNAIDVPVILCLECRLDARDENAAAISRRRGRST